MFPSLLSHSNVISLPLFITLLFTLHTSSTPQRPSNSFPLPNLNTSAVNNSFLFDLECTEAAFCEKAKWSIQSALNRLATVIAVRTPIRSFFRFTDICEGKIKCNTIGEATPSSLYSVQIASTEYLRTSVDKVTVGLNPGAAYLLPQALVKLSNIPIPSYLRFAEYDIHADFNSKYNWWFAQDNVPINATQSDFELVVLHEMLHGLGVGVSTFSLNSFFPNSLLPTYLNQGKDHSVHKFKPPTIWDAFLKVNTGSNFISWLTTYDLYDAVQREKVPSESTEAEFLTLVMTNATLSQDSTWRYTRGTTANTIEFVPKLSSSITNALFSATKGLNLETSLKPYEVGGSLAHLDFQTFRRSNDFLMVKSAPTTTLMQNPGYNSTFLTSGLGPATVLILQSLGYQIIGLKDNLSPIQGQILFLNSATLPRLHFSLLPAIAVFHLAFYFFH